MIREYESVKQFGQNAPDLYAAFKEYAENDMALRGVPGAKKSAVSVKEMEDCINKEFAIELQKRVKYTPEELGGLQRYANSTIVKEFADNIRDYLIDMVLPDTLMNSAIRYFADFRFADLGDSMSFELENNALYNVSRAGYRKRHTNLQKLFNTTVTLVPENHQLTVGTDLFEILSNRVSIARETMKAVRSIETAMLFDAYDAFQKVMGDLTGNLAVANYSEGALISLCERVTAYNGGRKAVILGTPVALKNVLPSNNNYRYLLDSPYVEIGHLPVFNTYDVIPLTQIANPYDYEHPYALKLDDTKIYVVSPAADKIVKIGVGGTLMSHTDGIYDNANLLQMTTLNKAWDTIVATNSIGGIVKNLEA